MIVIDGSFGEGGGQILRTSIGLAAALGVPVRIFNIRAKRRNPGLQRQHMTAVRVLAEISRARVEGLHLGSTELLFEPRTLRGGRYRFDIGTAGSVTLVIQALLPVLPFVPEPIEIEIRGGTDVPWSPPVDYVKHVLIPILSRMGYRMELEVVRRGHYPRGGGIVVLRSQPSGRIQAVELSQRGELVKIRGFSHAVKLPKHVAERQAKAAEERLRNAVRVPIEIATEWYPPDKDPHLGPGSGIVLVAECRSSLLGADALGAKGKRAEEVGREAADKLLEELGSGAALDRHMGDMIVAPAALACGTTVFTASRFTMHAYTVMEIVKKFLDIDIEIRGEMEKPFRAKIVGACVEK